MISGSPNQSEGILETRKSSVRHPLFSPQRLTPYTLHLKPYHSIPFVTIGEENGRQEILFKFGRRRADKDRLA